MRLQAPFLVSRAIPSAVAGTVFGSWTIQNGVEGTVFRSWTIQNGVAGTVFHGWAIPKRVAGTVFHGWAIPKRVAGTALRMSADAAGHQDDVVEGDLRAAGVPGRDIGDAAPALDA